jgi:phosphoglucomutase/phosphomannomutase
MSGQHTFRLSGRNCCELVSESPIVMNMGEKMAISRALEIVSGLLANRYKEPGRAAAERLQRWMSGSVPFAYPEELAKHFSEEHLPLLFESFRQELPFGTGGRRGPVGYGPNRVNPTMIALTVQGHCKYLRNAFPERKDLAVVVANDVRVFNDLRKVYDFLAERHPLLGVSSRSLAKLACQIYAANGFIVYLEQPEAEHAVVSTPELSFLIGKLGSAGGINLSASHNPPDDNGIKVYDEYGSQPVAPKDQELTDAMDAFQDTTMMPFNQALQEGKIRAIPPASEKEYVLTYTRLYNGTYAPESDDPIVYTPLCGSGDSSAGAVLRELGFPIFVPKDQYPDGTFSVIPFRIPNPEVPEATEPAKKFAEAQKSGIVLCSDPDADRVGLEARLADGSWYHFDGNQIATILCYFLMLDPKGPQRRGLVIETLVTTKILRPIVEKAGDSWLIDDLLVGFKYIANVLKQLQREGCYRGICCSVEQLVLAAEESHGVMVVPSIRDKDSTPACMYLAALYQRLRREGRTLLDYYLQILQELGPYADISRSILMAGAEGESKRDHIMKSLRDSPPEALAGQEVTRIVDHHDQEVFGPFVSKTDMLPRNVIQFFTSDLIITVRPSGTEPKLKFYCQLLPGSNPPMRTGLELLHETRARAEAKGKLVYNELLSCIGLRLEDAGLLLPDIVYLEQKLEFEQHTIPRLREAIASNRFQSLSELLDWLRQEVAAMTPGADPLPALKGPMGSLCRTWAREGVVSPLLAQLTNWAEHDQR